MRPAAFTILIYLNLLFLAAISSDAGEKVGSSVSPKKLMEVFVVPKQELIVIQWKNLNTENLEISLRDVSGESIQKTILPPGSTIAYFETQTLYAGEYEIIVTNGIESFTQKIILAK